MHEDMRNKLESRVAGQVLALGQQPHPYSLLCQVRDQ
jgi:hypothetical protein